jgi:bacteriorhodopsin
MEQTWLLVGLAGLAAGMVPNLAPGRRRTEHEEAHSLVHGLVPMIAASAYLAVLYVVWGPLRAEPREEEPPVRSTYDRNDAVLTALWLAYPAVLAFGADGLGHVGPVESTAAIAVLDVLAKTAFGLMAVTRNRRLVAEDPEPREARPRVVGVQRERVAA